MRIAFDPDFDFGAWPGPLVDRAATFGELWAGPAAILDVLETALGIGGPIWSLRMRAALLVPVVRATEGFWSRSAEVDPLGAARRLLQWRDRLAMYGWRGEHAASAPRLEALARITNDAPPGAPDRLAAVRAALERRRVDVASIELFEPLADFPPRWQEVFEALAARGVVVCERAIAETPARGDLQAARASGFAPAGDGSLVLLRACGPQETAEEVAAWLAGFDDLRGTLVIGADSILDRALRRHGLPATGARAEPEDHALLQVLPLVLAMGWTPADPRRAFELLSLPLGPVPPSLARRLLEALAEWPAVDSDLWRQKLAEGLAAIENAEDRARVEARLAALFAPVERDGRYPVRAVERRLKTVATWLSARLEHEDEDRAPWHAAIAQRDALARLIALAHPGDFTRPALERFVAEATAETTAPPLFRAETGLGAVAVPGAVVGPATRIVWWSFTRDAAPTIPDVPLSRGERATLAAAGVALPDRGRLALALARRWRRPLLEARDALLFACPRRDFAGDRVYPHPLWDEIVAGLVDRTAVRRLEAEVAGTPRARRPRPLRATPESRRAWRVVGTPLGRRDLESPSSVAQLIGCSFRWTLERLARIAAGTALPSGALLLGKLAHEVIERTLSARPASAEVAGHEAERIFDSEGPRLAASLFLAGAEAERADARHVMSAAAGELARLVAFTGLPVTGFEQPRRTAALGAALEGRIDLLLGPPPAVVDLKWGSSTRRRDELKRGTAHQLAAYARVLSEGASRPPAVAYFIVRDQRLLTTDRTAFPGAEVVRGPAPAETWTALERAFAGRRSELDDGRLVAPGNPDAAGRIEPDEDAVVAGRLVLEPGCRFCELGRLCGRAFGGSP